MLSSSGILQTVTQPTPFQIGFYHICSVDPSVLRNGTDFADLHDTFSGAWDKITNALKTAHRYGIGVLFGNVASLSYDDHRLT